MSSYYFDSSGVIKGYINEKGTSWVKGLIDPLAGNRIYVAHITGVEVISAISRLTRGGSITASDAAKAISQFRHDFAHQYIIVDINAALISNAMAIAEKHYLRGYDAVQLAGAMEVHNKRVSAGLSALTMICADNAVNTAALAEGLLVDNPNNY